MMVPSAIGRTTLLLVDPDEESRRDTHLHLAAAGFHVLSHSLASNALESPRARLARLLLATAHRDNQSDVEQLLPRLRSRGWSGTGIVFEPRRVCRRHWVVSHAAISMLSAAA